MKKFLIAGLGNIGEEYSETRHNIGFKVLDHMVYESGTSFSTDRYADICEVKLKNKVLLLIKPSTYMNLSGKAINYWLQKENIPLSNLLVVVDEVALPFGALRLKTKGSDGGHNGLKNINQVLGRSDYSRLRFGIGNDYPKGGQINYVLGKWTEEELQKLPPRLELAKDAINTFALAGPQISMNQFNGA